MILYALCIINLGKAVIHQNFRSLSGHLSGIAVQNYILILPILNLSYFILKGVQRHVEGKFDMSLCIVFSATNIDNKVFFLLLLVRYDICQSIPLHLLNFSLLCRSSCCFPGSLAFSCSLSSCYSSRCRLAPLSASGERKCK